MSSSIARSYTPGFQDPTPELQYDFLLDHQVSVWWSGLACTEVGTSGGQGRGDSGGQCFQPWLNYEVTWEACKNMGAWARPQEL